MRDVTVVLVGVMVVGEGGGRWGLFAVVVDWGEYTRGG